MSIVNWIFIYSHSPPTKLQCQYMILVSTTQLMDMQFIWTLIKFVSQMVVEQFCTVCDSEMWSFWYPTNQSSTATNTQCTMQLHCESVIPSALCGRERPKMKYEISKRIIVGLQPTSIAFPNFPWFVNSGKLCKLCINTRQKLLFAILTATTTNKGYYLTTMFPKLFKLHMQGRRLSTSLGWTGSLPCLALDCAHKPFESHPRHREEEVKLSPATRFRYRKRKREWIHFLKQYRSKRQYTKRYIY